MLPQICYFKYATSNTFPLKVYRHSILYELAPRSQHYCCGCE